MSAKIFDNAQALVQDLLDKLDKKIVFGSGFGRPAHILNELYRRAVADPTIELTIITGLLVERPRGSSDMESRFIDPFVERVFGSLPDMDFVRPYKKGTLPDNINVIEIFMSAGSAMNSPYAQQQYIYSNFTFWFRDMVSNGCNVFGHELCFREVDGERQYSMSSEAFVRDALLRLEAERKKGKKIALVAQVNQEMPFMFNDAIVEESCYDFILDNRDCDHTLLGVPSQVVETNDYMIGLHASSLLPDGGTLQIGIGSLGDAITYGLILRQRKNEEYLAALEELGTLDANKELIEEIGCTKPFEKGIYGATEMFADGFRHLFDAGILKREVYDDVNLQQLLNDDKIQPEITMAALDELVDAGVINAELTQQDVDYLKKFGFFKADVSFDGQQLTASDGTSIEANLNSQVARNEIEHHCLGERLAPGIVLHAGFFLGPQAMYEALRTKPEADLKKISMTNISHVNQLYRCEEIARLQRANARFMNTTIMTTLLGAACSDGLDDGRKVSGVGGQYNFVAMAHALDDGRSVLMCRSTRSKDGKVSSNIVWNYGHTTIPAHMRDIVVTEYGIADVRGKSEKDVIATLLNITDSRFQDELLEQAKEAKKIPQDYEIPAQFRDNTPQKLARITGKMRKKGLLPKFPFGTDFTHEELILAGVLKNLKKKLASKTEIFKLLAGAVEATMHDTKAAMPYLKRMGLDNPSSIKDTAMQKLLLSELEHAGILKAEP